MIYDIWHTHINTKHINVLEQIMIWICQGFIEQQIKRMLWHVVTTKSKWNQKICHHKNLTKRAATSRIHTYYLCTRELFLANTIRLWMLVVILAPSHLSQPRNSTDHQPAPSLTLWWHRCTPQSHKFSPDAPLEESLTPPHWKPRDKRNGQDDDEGQEPKKSVSFLACLPSSLF